MSIEGARLSRVSPLFAARILPSDLMPMVQYDNGLGIMADLKAGRSIDVANWDWSQTFGNANLNLNVKGKVLVFSAKEWSAENMKIEVNGKEFWITKSDPKVTESGDSFILDLSKAGIETINKIQFCGNGHLVLKGYSLKVQDVNQKIIG